jgi:hypothetical protein
VDRPEDSSPSGVLPQGSALEGPHAGAGQADAVPDVLLTNGAATHLYGKVDVVAGSINKFADDMAKLSHSSENRARVEKLKGLAADYVKGTQQIVVVRSEAIGLRTVRDGSHADAVQCLAALPGRRDVCSEARAIEVRRKLLRRC